MFQIIEHGLRSSDILLTLIQGTLPSDIFSSNIECTIYNDHYMLPAIICCRLNLWLQTELPNGRTFTFSLNKHSQISYGYWYDVYVVLHNEISIVSPSDFDAYSFMESSLIDALAAVFVTTNTFKCFLISKISSTWICSMRTITNRLFIAISSVITGYEIIIQKGKPNFLKRPAIAYAINIALATFNEDWVCPKLLHCKSKVSRYDHNLHKNASN